MSKGLEAWERIKEGIDTNVWKCGYWDDIDTIENNLKALNEILVLYNKWIGNEISDFEFFTLLNEITTKYDLLKGVLL